MDENLSNFDQPGSGDLSGRNQKPRFQLNLQTVATVVLVLALVAIVWLFFGPQPEPEVAQDLPTPTLSTLLGTGEPAVVGRPGTGTPEAAVSGSPAAATPGSPAAVGTAVMASSAASGTPEGAIALGTAISAAPSGTIAEGAFVAVGNTDGYGIRLRFGPGADFATIRIVMDGEVLQVVSGPERAEGLVWWRVQDSQGNIGWSAEQYLGPASAPASWAPPAASPTFEAGSGAVAPPATEPSTP